MTKTLIALFESTNETIRAEKIFKLNGIKVRAVIKPRKIASNCQMALSFPIERLGAIKKAVGKESLKLVGFFRQINGGDWVNEN